MPPSPHPESVSAPVSHAGAFTRMRPAVLALAGVAQGWAIYFALRYAEDARLAPEHAAALGFVCMGGFTMQLLLRESFAAKKLWAAAGWGLLWTAPFAWVFHRGLAFDFSGRDATLALSAALAAFLTAPFLTGEWRYAKLFARMCDNILAALAGLCVAAVSFLLVRLGAELFAILGIDILKEWVKTDFFFWTFFPALFGAGLALPAWRFRNLALMALRLPGAFGAVLALTFAAALIVAGPAPLWERNIAAPLLLTFTALLLIFTVAAFGEGEKTAKEAGEKTNGDSAVASGKWARGVLSLSLLVLPVFSGLALWGIWIRIGQYGLTPPRIWAGLAGIFLLASSVSYALCALFSLIVKRGESGGRVEWLSGLRFANPILVLFAVGILYFSHTPVLDPWRLSSQSQVLRAADSESDLRDLDLGAIYNFGGYGLSGIRDLEVRLRDGGERAEFLLAEMEALQLARESGELDLYLASRGWSDAPIYGEATATATEIVRAMKLEDKHWNLSCLPPMECALLALDLTGDAAAEHCLIRSHPKYAHLDCFIREGEKFSRLGGLLPRTTGGDWFAGMPDDLKSGKWKTQTAAAKDVVIGGRVFFLYPDDPRGR